MATMEHQHRWAAAAGCLTCPKCRSRLEVFETSSGGALSQFAGLKAQSGLLSDPLNIALLAQFCQRRHYMRFVYSLLISRQ
jgi:hypothetical protein